MFYVQIGAEYYMLLAVALLLIPRNVLHAHSPPSITVFEGRMEIPTSGHHDGGQAGLQRRFGEERTATIDNTEEPLIQYNMLVTGVLCALIGYHQKPPATTNHAWNVEA